LLVFLVGLQVYPIRSQHFGPGDQQNKVVNGILGRSYGFRGIGYNLVDRIPGEKNDRGVDDIQDH
jgi:hypothetical protein